jgi:hypothetical protein
MPHRRYTDGFGDYRRGDAVACSQLHAHRELLRPIQPHASRYLRSLLLADIASRARGTSSLTGRYTAVARLLWTQRQDIGPSARSSFALAHDSVRKLTYLFGGGTASQDTLGLPLENAKRRAARPALPPVVSWTSLGNT